MDIVFTCGSCGQSIEIDEAGAGQLVDCPQCGTVVEVPYKSQTLGIATPPLVDGPSKLSHSTTSIFVSLGLGVLLLGTVFFVFKFWNYQQTFNAQQQAAKAEEAAKSIAARAKKAEAARAAEEAKRVEDGNTAIEAELQKARAEGEAKYLVETALRRLQDTMQEAAKLGPNEAQARIDASIEEVKAAMQQAQAMSPLDPSEIAKADEALRLIEQTTVGFAQRLERQKVQIADFSWTKDESGTFMIASFVVENRSRSNVKDIEVTCRHFAPSGTEIDSNTRTIYEIIPAGRRLTIKNFNMGFIHSQAQRSQAEVTDFTVMR